MDSGFVVFIGFLCFGLIVIIILAAKNQQPIDPSGQPLSPSGQTPPPEPPTVFLKALLSYVENASDEAIKKQFLSAAVDYYFYASEENTGLFIPRDRDDRKHRAYRDILQLLQKYPNIPKLHTMALDFGRLSYGATRPNRVLTIYDENAIANDIKAAAGAAHAHPETALHTTTSDATTRSPAERLSTLTQLRDDGFITPEEYETKRAAILNDI